MKILEITNKVVRASDPLPKLSKPTTGREQPHPYTGMLVGSKDNNLDEISMQDIKKTATGIALGGALLVGAGKIANYMNQSSYDNSIQLPQLEMYLDYAEQQKDQRMVAQLKQRIKNHESRLAIGKGDVYGPDGTPMSFEIVYDKENPNVDPLGDPMEFNKQFAKARDQKRESKEYNSLEESVGEFITEEEFEQLAEKQDACYHKVKSRYKVWPSAYASGALVKCRKVGAKNWGNSSKKKKKKSKKK